MGSINTTDFVCVKDLRDDTLIHACVNVLFSVLSGHRYFLGFLVIKHFVWASLWSYWGVVTIANSAVTLCRKLQFVQEIHGTQGSKRCLWKFGGKLYKLLVGQSSMSAHSSENLKQSISHPPYSGLLYSPSVCHLPHLQTSVLCQMYIS